MRVRMVVYKAKQLTAILIPRYYSTVLGLPRRLWANYIL